MKVKMSRVEEIDVQDSSTVVHDWKVLMVDNIGFLEYTYVSHRKPVIRCLQAHWPVTLSHAILTDPPRSQLQSKI